MTRFFLPAGRWPSCCRRAAGRLRKAADGKHPDRLPRHWPWAGHQPAHRRPGAGPRPCPPAAIPKCPRRPAPAGQGRVQERARCWATCRWRVHAHHAGHHRLGVAQGGLQLLPCARRGPVDDTLYTKVVARKMLEMTRTDQRRVEAARQGHRRHLLHLPPRRAGAGRGLVHPAGAGQAGGATPEAEGQNHPNGDGGLSSAIDPLTPYLLKDNAHPRRRRAHLPTAAWRASSRPRHLRLDDVHEQGAGRELHPLPQHALARRMGRRARRSAPRPGTASAWRATEQRLHGAADPPSRPTARGPRVTSPRSPAPPATRA
jgi:hypothetical protein